MSFKIKKAEIFLRTLQTEPQTRNKNHISRSRTSPVTTTLHGWISLLNHPRPAFPSRTLFSLSVSGPRGQCQQEVGPGRHMKQSMLPVWLVLHSGLKMSRGVPK